ncbi:MAG: alpha/beta fold hydrolase [Arenicella sp.]
MLILFIFCVIGCLASFILAKTVLSKHPAVGQFIQVDYSGETIRLHYLDSLADKAQQGSNQPVVVLIHGATGNVHDFQSSIFETLATHYRVIAFDRPGLGYSERPRQGRSKHWCNPQEQMRLIRSALLALGIDQPFVLGHSLAGPVVLDYMMEFGDEMSGAILMSPVSHPWPNGVTWYNYLDMFPGIKQLLVYTWLPVIGYFNVSTGLKKLFDPEQPTQGYREKTALDLFFRPQVMLDNFRDQRLLCEYVALAGRKYRQITTPVQIITGKDDDVVSSWLHAEKLSYELQNVQWLDIPGVGHAPHHSRTDEVIRTIQQFVDHHKSEK